MTGPLVYRFRRSRATLERTTHSATQWLAILAVIPPPGSVAYLHRAMNHPSLVTARPAAGHPAIWRRDLPEVTGTGPGLADHGVPSADARVPPIFPMWQGAESSRWGDAVSAAVLSPLVRRQLARPVPTWSHRIRPAFTTTCGWPHTTRRRPIMSPRPLRSGTRSAAPRRPRTGPSPSAAGCVSLVGPASGSSSRWVPDPRLVGNVPRSPMQAAECPRGVTATTTPSPSRPYPGCSPQHGRRGRPSRSSLP